MPTLNSFRQVCA